MARYRLIVNEVDAIQWNVDAVHPAVEQFPLRIFISQDGDWYYIEGYRHNARRWVGLAVNDNRVKDFAVERVFSQTPVAIAEGHARVTRYAAKLGIAAPVPYGVLTQGDGSRVPLTSGDWIVRHSPGVLWKYTNSEFVALFAAI